jgi:UDP-glucuronate 4-epimerase
MKILLTGTAGFIGFHLAKKLLEQGHSVIGLDNINGYYSVQLKLDRLKQLGINEVFEGKLVCSEIYGEKFQFIKLDLENRNELPNLFKRFQFDAICNMAAQAGVRYSIENPMVYIESNIVGFVNLLECMRFNNVNLLLYASSSSVYGNSSDTPFSENNNVDFPVSIYAATKKSNELMAYSYSHLFGIKTIGLRFFTVYGPWGRPDMAMFLFTDSILKNLPISVFNNGDLSRDFTYIDDIIIGISEIIILNETQTDKYQLYNIGNSKPVKLINFIEAIEKELGIKAIKKMTPMQSGDVNKTWANVDRLEKNYGYKPKTTIEDGVHFFVKWYKDYYKV